MAKLLILSLALVAVGSHAAYIWDLLPLPMSAPEVYGLLETAVPGETFPNFNTIPVTSFNCSQQQWPGYFADVETGCQVIRRCPFGGGPLVSYLCPNYTLFNQLTLVCDWWFNVDCARAKEFYSFANPNIYDQKKQLHENPPKGYMAPHNIKMETDMRSQADSMQTENAHMMGMMQKQQDDMAQSSGAAATVVVIKSGAATSSSASEETASTAVPESSSSSEGSMSMEESTTSAMEAAMESTTASS